MKVKDGFAFAENKYEVRIGGVLADDYYSCVVTGEELDEIVYGDADGNGVVTDDDAVLILRYGAGWASAISSIDVANANANADEAGITDDDAVLILRVNAGWTTVKLGPQ